MRIPGAHRHPRRHAPCWWPWMVSEQDLGCVVLWPVYLLRWLRLCSGTGQITPSPLTAAQRGRLIGFGIRYAMMVCCVYFTSFYCFLLFGGDRWQLLMGQLRNSIVIYGASTTRQCLNVLPDRALQSRSDCDFDSTRTAVARIGLQCQIPDFNGLGLRLFSITLHVFLQVLRRFLRDVGLLTDWGDQTPNQLYFNASRNTDAPVTGPCIRKIPRSL